jgi:hypothetical protein
MNVDSLAERVNEAVASMGRWVDAQPPVPLNRAVGLVLALPSWTVLGLAAWLTPSPRGYGTHLQLGLGECTMLHLTGYPCPMCGMTTTFTLFAHLRPIDAVVNQPFGIVLFSTTVAAAAIGLADLLSGRGYWRVALRWVDRRESRLAAVLMFGMLGGWVYKVIRLHPELIGMG